MPDSRYDTLDGGCDCRNIRYRLQRKPLIVHCCHCRVCQRQTGSAFVLNALVETDALDAIKGATEIVDMQTPSGAGQRIHRCPRCWIAVWSHYLRLGPQVAFVRVGTMDDPNRCPPDVHIYASWKQPWLELPSESVVVPEFYRRSECWSKASLERLALLSSNVED